MFGWLKRKKPEPPAPPTLPPGIVGPDHEMYGLQQLMLRAVEDFEDVRVIASQNSVTVAKRMVAESRERTPPTKNAANRFETHALTKHDVDRVVPDPNPGALTTKANVLTRLPAGVEDFTPAEAVLYRHFLQAIPEEDRAALYSENGICFTIQEESAYDGRPAVEAHGMEAVRQLAWRLTKHHLRQGNDGVDDAGDELEV